jgi:hypothetical protein
MVAVAVLGVVLNVAINPPRISALPGCHYLFLAGPCQFIESRKRFQLRQDGGEIFRHRRVNMHRALDHRVGGLCVHDSHEAGRFRSVE